MNEYKKGVIEMIKELKSISEVDESLGLIDSGFLDSFDIITLIDKMEEDFAIKIPGAEIIPENLNSYNDIASLIKRIKDE